MPSFAETVVSRRRHKVAEEFLDEPSTAKCCLDVAGQGRVERKGDVGIAGAQRQVTGWVGERVESMESMRPAADHDHLVEPGSKSRDQAAERLGVVHVSVHPR